MNLIKLSIKRPVFAWVLMFSLIVFGAVSWNKMGISQMPDVNFPVLNITVAYDGASPSIIENELVDPIEERLLSVEGVKEMRSQARQSQGSVTLEFDINRNIDVALQEVQSALSQLRMPPGVDPPIIQKQNPEEDPILILSIYGDAPLKDMLSWIDTYLLDQIQFIPGVGEVGVGGFSTRNLRVWLDKKKLENLDLTIGDIIDTLQTQHIESAVGQYSEEKREVRVRWAGEAVTPEEVGNIQILKRAGQMIQEKHFKIKDVAEIEDGLSDIRRLGRVDGKQAVGLRIKKQRGTNEVTVSKAIVDKMNQIQKNFPAGFKYRVNVDFTRSTESTVHLTNEKLIAASIITVLVCFLFLGNFASSINILFSIPTSVLGTFIILNVSGFTLNLFTLLALTLSISIVVDDAIMLLENIIRHSRMGKAPKTAAYDGAIEVMPAAIAATLAVVAVFLPVVFMDGVIGKFFYQFGITMSAAVLLSLLEAITITPMRAAAFLSAGPRTSKFEHRLEQRFELLGIKYQNILKKTLRFRFVILLMSLIFFATSVFQASKLGQELVPAQDQDIIILNAQAKASASLQLTDFEAKRIEAILSNDPDIEGFFTSVGAGGPSALVNQIFIPITLKPKNHRKSSHTQVMSRLREQFKALKPMRIGMRDISARQLTSGKMNPVAFNIRGPNLSVLNTKSEEIIKELTDKKIAVDLDTDYKAGAPELYIEPKRDELAARGVSVEAVGQVLQASVGGIRHGSYTSSGRRYDIRFKLLDSQIKGVADIESLYVRNLAGNLVRLSEIVKISERPASQTISRINRSRAISISGSLGPGVSQSEAMSKTAAIVASVLPPGYSMGLEGATAGFLETFKNLRVALYIGIFVAYLILAVQFNSFRLPVSVLMALPFGASGVFMTLGLMGQSLNLFSYIGLIVLMGIAKKNSIMLVQFSEHIRVSERISANEAVLKACAIRLRPILMTSVATIAAALPLVLGSEMGSEARAPMGLAIIGGTVVSTVLTLFVVPIIYVLLAPKKIQIEIEDETAF